MSTMYNLLHIPLCTVMLILIFNSTAYCHAHSFTFYILFFISYFSFILSYVYFPCVVFSIFALSMERTRLSFHCWLYSLCIVVYVTNKTWNLKLEIWLNPFIKSVFAAHFKTESALCLCDQLVIRVFPQLRTAQFTVNKCSELVYCTCFEFSARFGTQRPPVMLYFCGIWLQHLTSLFVVRYVFVSMFSLKLEFPSK